MKNKKRGNKLSLNKTTISNLNMLEMNGIKGGYTTTGNYRTGICSNFSDQINYTCNACPSDHNSCDKPPR